MATRRIGNSRFDHGAQFFTVRDARFRERVAEWEQAGLVTPWFSEAGHIRYRAAGGMNALAKYLAQSLAVRLETKVTSVKSNRAGWTAVTDKGEILQSDALLMTPPAEQCLALLTPPPDIATALRAMEFDPCFALLAALDGPSLVPPPGYIRPESGPIEWLADNTQKGVSERNAALTIHARGDFSRQYFDAPHDEVSRLLLNAAEPWLGSAVTASQLHRWRYSKPVSGSGPLYLYAADPAPLAFAGDAFAGGRVEGAFLSGLAAAEALLNR
jgi:predicted NAD/FAD-dependent oxidoreductase